MAGNSFGQLFRITTFGESHGEAIGVIIDGCPAQLTVDLDYIQSELDKRKPGQSKITTQRKESDTVKILSGVFEGKTTGTPIAMLIPNEDQRSKDYTHNVDPMPTTPTKPNTASATIAVAAVHPPAKLPRVLQPEL
jgi:chorismate synthase